MKLIIAGGREFNNYRFLCVAIEDFFSIDPTNIEIISGGSTGADSLGERFARENNYPIKIFPALWQLYGRSAGAIRNKQMAEYATDCICFWDGESRGTKMMIELAKEHGINPIIISYSK